MNRAQRASQVLLGLQQMMQVGPGIIQRSVGGHLRIHGSEVVLEAGIRQGHPAIERVHTTTAGKPRRSHAVKGVGTGLDSGKNIVRLGNPQQVAGAVVGKLVVDPTADQAQILLLNRPTNAIAVEAELAGVLELAGELHQPARGLAAQVFVLRTLHDTE